MLCFKTKKPLFILYYFLSEDGELIPRQDSLGEMEQNEKSALNDSSFAPASYLTSYPQSSSQVDENGEYCGGMDGETGEWCPAPASSSSVKINGFNSHHGSARSSDSEDDTGEFSEKAVKQVAREFLDHYTNENRTPENPSYPVDPFQKTDFVSPCRLFLKENETKFGLENGEEHDLSEHISNGHGPLKCNSTENHSEISNGYTKQIPLTNHAVKT